MNHLSLHGVAERLADDTTSGTTTISGTALDMTGYAGVMFFCILGTANAGNYLSAQQGAASDGSDGATLEGSKCTVSVDGGVAIVDVQNPQEKYVRPQVVRGAATTISEIWAVRYGKDKQPVSQTNCTRVTAPAEGTA